MCTRVLIFMLSLALAILPACAKPQPTETGQKSVILEEGSTRPNPDYFITDKGDIIYKSDPSGSPGLYKHNPNFPPVFEGAQRVFPSGENPEERESYLTLAPLQTVVDFYKNYLDIRLSDPQNNEKLPPDFAVVQMVESRDPDGRRQVALFVNRDEGPRGGMKVLLKEFPAQKAVQIILTTLDATPPGLNPIGFWITPEEVQKWAEEEARRQAEQRALREKIEQMADEQERARRGETGK